MSHSKKSEKSIIVFDTSALRQAIEKAFEVAYANYSTPTTENESENYRKFIRIMSELDWPAFLEYDPDLHTEIISCVEAEDADGITDALYNHFNGLFLKELEDRLEASTVIQPDRLPVIQEALLLYRLGYFYGSVSILITQLEGIISDIDEYISRSAKTYNAKNLRLLDTRYKVKRNSQKGIMIKILLDAKDINAEDHEYDYLIGYLRMKMFNGSLSEEELSEHANRHAICHGEQCNYGSKEQALKVILCIDALEYVAEVISEQCA